MQAMQFKGRDHEIKMVEKYLDKSGLIRFPRGYGEEKYLRSSSYVNNIRVLLHVIHVGKSWNGKAY
jgi:hypothetical protein